MPHALIRHFAKSAAFALRDKYPELYSNDEMLQLETVNKSPFIQIDRKEASMPRGQLKEGRECRFGFNGMDTIPYWYEPLGARFGCGAEVVVEIAERWICDKWGFRNENVGDDWLRRRYDWELWGNHQGADPIAETLETYLEWHAMFCAADELLRNRPVILDEWEKDPFDDWLTRWTLAWPNHWLSDMRDPVPLEDIYWHLERPESEDWEQQILPVHLTLLLEFLSHRAKDF